MFTELKLDEIVTTIPTVGFNVETISHKNISFTLWDVGGGRFKIALRRHCKLYHSWVPFVYVFMIACQTIRTHKESSSSLTRAM